MPPSTTQANGAPAVVLAGASRRAVEEALPFAQRAAAYFEAPVDVRLADPTSHDLGIAVEEPEWLGEMAAQAGVRASAVAVRDIPEAIEQYARTHSPRLAIAAAGREDLTTPYYRNLVAAPPCGFLIFRNVGEGFAPSRVLVATNTFAPLSDDATRLTYVLARVGPDAHTTFLRLVAPDTTDSAIAELTVVLKERVAERAGELSFDLAVRRARSYEVGILEAVEEGDYDLVIADIPRSGLVARFAQPVLPQRLLRHETPMLLYSAPSGRAVRALLQAWNFVYRMIPSTDEAERASIYSDIRRRSRADADYYVMLAMSVLIASFGLLLDSAAVVIGAMIIAPLMQPIIGLGLGISMGNSRLTRLAIRTAGKGTLAALLLAMAVGWLAGGDGITAQLDSRGQPGVLDLLIALASGAAGAYASCRKGVAESVAGVAIAVALIPPLGTAGIGLAFGEWPLAMGASLLFVTNFVAIATSSALMFLWMGFKPEPGRFGGRAPLVRGVAALGVLVAVVAISLVLWTRAGNSRFERTVEEAVRIAVQSIEPDAEVIGIEVRNRDADVLVVIARVDTVEVDLVAENELAIQSTVSQQLHRPVQLLVRPVTAR